jgi:hypothetical protein
VRAISKYLEIETRIYTKEGQKYDIFENVNPDIYTPKKYNKTLVENAHSLLELKFNLSDAVLEGSGDSVDFMKEVVNQY